MDMKLSCLIKQIGIGLSVFCFTAVVQASPVWTLTPVPEFPPKVSIGPTDTTSVQYTVTNQSSKSHLLQMKPIRGITPSGCTSPLGAHESCTLTLYVNGELSGTVKGGPVLCSQGNPNQCYQPSRVDSLDVQVLTPAQLAVSLAYGSIFFAPPEVETRFHFSDLLKYEVTFPPESHWAPQKGLVDENGQFLIIDGQIVSNPAEIMLLLSTTTRIPLTPPYNPYTDPASSNDVANLLAYQTADNQIVFIDQLQRYAVVGGQVIGVNNSVTTFLDYISNLPLSSYGVNGEVPSNFSYDVVRSLASFVEGDPNAPKTIYVFGEPNCIYCHDFYEGMQPYVTSGQVSIHWILVSFLQPTSQGKVWAILDGKVPPGSGYSATPAGAFAYNEDNFNTTSESGGIPPSTNPSAYAIRSLNENEAAFIRYTGLGVGTPLTVFINNEGQTEVMGGLPNDYTSFVNSIKDN